MRPSVLKDHIFQRKHPMIQCTVVPLFTTLYLRPPLIIRPLEFGPKGQFSVLNDLCFKTTCNIRPHFLGPMSGLKIEEPLYIYRTPYSGAMCNSNSLYWSNFIHENDKQITYLCLTLTWGDHCHERLLDIINHKFQAEELLHSIVTEPDIIHHLF